MTMKPLPKDYALLHILLFVNTFGGVCSKLAARQEPFSTLFFMFYGLMLLILFSYAIFWQQIIKKIPLSTAYLNKQDAILWGILWGVLIFKEQITGQMVLGAIVVMAGIVMVVRADE